MRLCAINFSGLGDTLFFLPALAAARARHPRLEVTCLTMMGSVRALLEASPHVDRVIHIDALRQGPLGNVLAFWGLRKERFDVGVVPYASNRLEYNVANFLMGARLRAAHRYTLHPWRNLSFLNNRLCPEVRSLHAVEENFALLHRASLLDSPRAVAAPPGSLLTIPEERARQARQRLSEQSGSSPLLIGVHTGTNTIKNQHRRRYPAPRYAAALEQILRNHPEAFLVFFCGPSEEEQTREVSQRVSSPRQMTAREPDILGTAALMKACHLFVSNDSGPLHMAASLGLPCVALFGPTNPDFVHPWAIPHRVVRLSLPCQPCFDYSSRPLSCPAGLDYACIRELPESNVAAAFEELLREVRP